MLVLTDSLYANAGLPGSFFKPPVEVRLGDGTTWVLFAFYQFLRAGADQHLWVSVALARVRPDLKRSLPDRRDPDRAGFRNVPVIGHWLRYRAEIVFALLLMSGTSTLFVSPASTPRSHQSLRRWRSK